MLNDLSKSIRRQILTEAYKHKHGHIASCFSCVEILLAIKEVMKEGDRFILSKGHAILAEKAVFGKEISCYKTGSLGHGLGVACGIALGDPDHNVYVVVGDGELQEGSCWEALQYIYSNSFDRDNLIVICDMNKYQASKKDTRFAFDALSSKVATTEVDGHNIQKIITEIQFNYRVIFCDTKKGFGVNFMEADPIRFHTDCPTEAEFQLAMKELQ